MQALSQATAGPLPLLSDMRHDSRVNGALFDKGAFRILSWSADGTIRLWDVATGQPVGAPMKHDGPVKGAVFDKAEGRILSWSEDRTVRLWDAATGQPLGAPMKHDLRVRGAVFDKAEGRILRVMAKVEWHPGELYPRVGFIVTNMSRPTERVVEARC